jgi:hypothetical protein
MALAWFVVGWSSKSESTQGKEEGKWAEIACLEGGGISM